LKKKVEDQTKELEKMTNKIKELKKDHDIKDHDIALMKKDNQMLL